MTVARFTVYAAVRAEYQNAQAALEAGDDDPDVLGLRYEAARGALHACIRVLKTGTGLPVQAEAPSCDGSRGRLEPAARRTRPAATHRFLDGSISSRVKGWQDEPI